MDPVKNPYVPNAGAMPPALPGRRSLIDAFEVALPRALAGKTPKSLLPYGLRGVGKTVLLNRFIQDAERTGYIVIFIEADADMDFVAQLVAELRRVLLSLDGRARVNETVKRAIRILKSFALKFNLGDLSLELGVEPERGQADTGDLTTDLTALLLAVGEAARSAATAVLIAIDEVQTVKETEFKALIMALHRITQRQLPVLAVATGLPQVVGLAGDAKTYAERLFDYREIGALSKADTFAAIAQPAEEEGVTFTAEALDRLYEATQGYPYFVQEWAYYVWNQAKSSPVGADVVGSVRDEVLAGLDQGFFRARYDRVTTSERRYLRAMAELGAGAQGTGDVAKVLGKTLSQLAPSRDALIKKGLIYSPEAGKVAFTVPLFADYMRRVEPTL